MKYNTHLDITNLKQNDFKDELTLNLTSLVYILGNPLLRLEEIAASPDFTQGKDTFFAGIQVTGVILNMIHTLVPQVKESEYADIYNASIKAMNVLYRDKIFADIRKKYTEAAEIDKSLVEVGELDEDEVMEFTDEELNLHIDYTLISGLAFINMAFYVTYKDQYDLLKLEDIDNPEFWYNKYFDLFIHNMNYLNFVTSI